MKSFKLHQVVYIAIFITSISCNENTKQDNSISWKSYNSIEGEWEVSFAEVINESPQTLNQSSIDNVESTANRYEYRFFPNNKFERGQPETQTAQVEEMHGIYEIDSINNKLTFYLEWNKPESRDTLQFDLIEINPYKIAFLEQWGTRIKVLTVLHRKSS